MLDQLGQGEDVLVMAGRADDVDAAGDHGGETQERDRPTGPESSQVGRLPGRRRYLEIRDACHEQVVVSEERERLAALLSGPFLQPGAGWLIEMGRRGLDQLTKLVAKLVGDRSQVVERVQGAEFGKRVLGVAQPAWIGFGDLDSREAEPFGDFGEGWLIASDRDRPGWRGHAPCPAGIEHGEHVGDVLDLSAE
jgi:hypothetical protein